MHRPVGPLSTLAFALALGFGASSPALLAALPAQSFLAQQAARQDKAQAHVMSLRSQLGLSERDAFLPAHTFTTPAGKAIVRMDHTYRGYRVLGSRAIAQVKVDGTIETLTRSVEANVAVAGEPALSSGQALAIALKALQPTTPLKFTPTIERIVFPATAVGGLVTKYDRATGRQTLDRTRSVFPLITAPYVWAYEVLTKEENSEQGPREMAYIIDGNTGQILRALDQLQRAAVTPATGTGKGLYNGTVSLPTTLLGDGKYALYDTTRGRLPNPHMATWSDPATGWTPTGLSTFYSGSDANGTTDYTMWLFMENPVNTWGDGLPFTQWGALGGANGQTAGVDAMHAMTSTWDFYGKVLGWDGMDGKGTSVYAEVLNTGVYGVDNAYWSDRSASLTMGAGSSTLPVTHPYYYAGGFKSLTDFDVIAHEMAHGVTGSTVRFLNTPGSEEAGLAEGTSDFFAQMAKIWARRPEGAAENAVPSTGNDWQIGRTFTPDGKPLRWMDKPSRDGRSAENWYDGMRFLDGHFSAGVLNRILYFLSQGASPVQGTDRYSPYLPGGMTGIGNDAATRIWFTTVTERLAGSTGAITFLICREEAIAAAKELYGAGAECVQSIAVENAFAAANVGLGHGQAPRTAVLFDNFRDGDWWDLGHNDAPGTAGSRYNNRQLFPEGHMVRPLVAVHNNANKEVAWTLGGPSLYNNGTTPGQYGWADKGGKLNADGSWTTPFDLGWYAITATSKADPSQFAEGRCFIVNVDCDQDGEFDACDMGGIALSWWLGRAINPSHSVFQAPWTDDADVFAIKEAMQNAWPVK